MVEVVNIKHVRDFGREGDIYIGRKTPQFPQSMWANPFPIGNSIVNGVPTHFSREGSIERYKRYFISGEIVNVNGKVWNAQIARKYFPDLSRAKRLGCWCKPEACHGDFLKELIDATQKTFNDYQEKTTGYKIEYQKYVTSRDLQLGIKKLPDGNFEYTSIFVYDDDDMRNGGQTYKSSGLGNIIGIRVKKSPGIDEESFYTDDEYNENIKKIDEDLYKLAMMANGKTIVFPSNGVGTGMSMLNRTAPRTFMYLTKSLKQIFNIDNGDVSKHSALYNEIDRKSMLSKILENTDRKQKRNSKTKLTRKIIRRPTKKVIKKVVKKCICKRR